MVKNIVSSVNKYIEKHGKINFVIILFTFIALILIGLYGTFALRASSQGISYRENTKTYKFIIGEDNSSNLTINSNDSKYVDITIINKEKEDLLYSLYYLTKEVNNDLIIGYLKNSSNKPSGTIKADNSLTVSLKVINNSSSNEEINFGIDSGQVNGGKLNNSGLRIETEIANLDKEEVNIPNIDNGLIPIYYDINNKAWYKADDSNMDKKHKWYDYSKNSKMWANAVLVSDETRNNYLDAKIGTKVEETDIIGYFVWIPRYKYHVWNVNKQPNSELDYSYSAYTRGIDIEFEKGVATTGNVICTYNIGIEESDKNLSESCSYNNNNITSESDNLNYENLWYTPSSFTYGGKELTGFWVGKFETTGGMDKPTILPNKLALSNLSISNGFTIIKGLNSYLTTKNEDAHLMKNTEWGAVAYLAHSIYGLCDEFTCRDAYMNNSSDGYTGRTSGTDAGVTTISKEGTFTYDGYRVGGNSDNQELNKVGSTTGNITGIYDMSGGKNEYVMSNTVDDKLSFNPKNSENNWSSSINLSEKYYDAYSTGGTIKDNKALNRTRLGDATAEVTANNFSVWTIGTDISGGVANFSNRDKPWLVRGGSLEKTAGIFYYNNADGSKNNNYSFRVVLS